MDRGLLIGEIAARSGASRKAPRLYERRGILPTSRRTASGYRVYPVETLGVLTFVQQGRRLGLTLAEIQQIIAMRRAGSPPCPHVRALLQRKAQELAALLTEVRRTLKAFRSTKHRPGAVCPHIEAKGDDTTWKRALCRSAPRASTAPKWSSKPIEFGSARTSIPSFSRRKNGTSWST